MSSASLLHSGVGSAGHGAVAPRVGCWTGYSHGSWGERAPPCSSANPILVCRASNALPELIVGCSYFRGWYQGQRAATSRHGQINLVGLQCVTRKYRQTQYRADQHQGGISC